MILAIINGILAFIAFETSMLSKQMIFKLAFRTATNMSLVLMASTKIAMNVTDFLFTGGAF